MELPIRVHMENVQELTNLCGHCNTDVGIRQPPTLLQWGGGSDTGLESPGKSGIKLLFRELAEGRNMAGR